MPTEQVEWIRSFSGGEMVFSDEVAPNGKAGRGSYLFVLMNVILGLTALGFAGWHLFLKPLLAS